MEKIEPTGTAKNQTILYVEDRQPWRKTVGMVLSTAGYTVLLFDDVSKARKYYGKHENEIAVALCDGSVNNSGDGKEWATELHEAGKKAVILSTEGAEGVPLLDKGGDWHTLLVPTLEKLIGG